ncbi:MAG TPA: nucleotidyl transferase AbiEii/AbiGii toxin family protein, partial [Thermotogota bacterium]|nr:nucleotidyl transferase AbiEii/AbiGii toxin family protein [Thermotogota bacterium]
MRRLSMSQYKNNFILKGGLFIYTLTEFQSRATQDIDFLMQHLTYDINRVKGIMEEICQTSSAND